MKKLSLITICLFFSIINIVNAQQRPVAGARSFTFGINGLQFIGFNTNASRTGSLLFRQYISDKNAIRVAANLTLNSNNNEMEDTTNGLIQTFGSSQYFGRISGGFQRSLGTRERLEPYIGVDAFFGLGNGKNTIRTELVNETKTASPNDKNGDYQESEINNATPFSIGLMPVLGFNYYIADGIALGGEFSYGLNFSSTAVTKRITTTRLNGVDQPKQEEILSPKNNTFTLQNLGTTNFTVSVFF